MANISFEEALEEALASVGSTWPIDIWMLYPYFILSLVGVICNIFNLVVFNHISFNSPLYKYLRVYCFTNIVYCLFGMARAFTTSYHIIWWANSKPVRCFYAYVYVPVSNIAYFFNSLIDILILFDRIAFFSRPAQRFLRSIKLSPYQKCFVALLVTIFLYSPMFVAPEPSSFTVKVMNQSAVVWFHKNSAYANSKLGIILKAIVLAFKDGLTTTLQVSLNLVSLFMFKAFLEKKRNLVLLLPISTAQSVQNQSTRDHEDIILSQIANPTRRESSTEQMASLMAISLVSLSILEHSMYTVSYIYSYAPFNLTTFIFFYYNSFFGSIKRILDLVVYLTFNKQFRTVSWRILRLES